MRVAIVIGGGHNGLVAGACLARTGVKTVVLEAWAKVGGAAATEAPWPEAPEFKVARYSYVTSLMPDSATHGGGGVCGIPAWQAVWQLRKDSPLSS